MNRLIVTFSGNTDDAFDGKVTVIIVKMTGNSYFPEPYPDSVPSIDTLSHRMDEWRIARAACLTHDSEKIALRNQIRQDITDKLKRLAQYIEFVANDDPVKLASTGFDLRRPPTGPTSANTELPAPTQLRVEHGKAIGELDISVAPVAGAAGRR